MRPATLNAVLAWGAGQAELVVVEGVMGLFDAAANDEGSTADLAARLGLPILLVVDAARQSQSVAALVHGFRRSEEHTSELQSLMRISYAVFCLKKKRRITNE